MYIYVESETNDELTIHILIQSGWGQKSHPWPSGRPHCLACSVTSRQSGEASMFAAIADRHVKLSGIALFKAGLHWEIFYNKTWGSSSSTTTVRTRDIVERLFKIDNDLHNPWMTFWEKK